MKYDICIIGAGVIGSAIARELSKYNISVALVEKGNDVSLGCSKANSGIIHGGYDAQSGTNKAHFNCLGNALFTQLNEELHFGIDFPGSLVVAYTEEEKKAVEKVYNNGLANGLSNLSLLSSQEIFEKEPNINKDAKLALFCPSCGIVSPYEFTIALAENAVVNDVQLLLLHEVKNIIKNKNRFLVQCQNEHKQIEIDAGIVINSAGVYSDVIAHMVGIDNFSIVPRKGNYCVFLRGYMPISHVLFQAPNEKGKGVLVSPAYHGNLFIGPDAYEVSHKNDTSPDEDKILQLQQIARKTLPDIDLTKVIRKYAGIRPTAIHKDRNKVKHKDFIIDYESVENFICLAGIESPGLTSSPALALRVRDIIEEIYQNKNKILQKKQNFKSHRKPFIQRQITRDFLPMKEVNERTKLPDANANKIICRCEQVLQQTVLQTFSQPFTPVSIDAIKRRTRVSMGICQGKFCRPRVKEILAKQLHKNIEDVSEK